MAIDAAGDYILAARVNRFIGVHRQIAANQYDFVTIDKNVRDVIVRSGDDASVLNQCRWHFIYQSSRRFWNLREDAVEETQKVPRVLHVSAMYYLNSGMISR